jgi:hypothetical protein
VQKPTNDENEFIEVVKLPLVKFKELLKKGEMTDTKTAYIGLEFLNLLV